MTKYKNTIAALSILVVATASLFLNASTTTAPFTMAQSDWIRINQIGYLPTQEKTASIVGGKPNNTFIIRDVNSGNQVFQGKLSKERASKISEEKTVMAQFTSLTKPGKYVLEIPQMGYSYSFEIAQSIYHQPAKAAMRTYFYQRSAIDLPQCHLGEYSRQASIADKEVIIHPSAASQALRAGSVVSSSGGWFDAGDYGKYIVNSAFTVGMLLGFYEDFEPYAKGQNLNIIESYNQTPDLIDEVMYNVKWMLTMQDENDGGVFHKLTSIHHDGFIAPSQQDADRYIIFKGVTSSLGFAASMAQTARIIKNYSRNYPNMEQQLIAAAEKAYQWATQNPNTLYDQKEQNKKLNETMNTGEYDDKNADDEFFWAAVELYLTTQKEVYLEDMIQFAPQNYRLPTWNQTYGLGSLALIRNRALLNHTKASELATQQLQFLLQYVDEKSKGVEESPYQASYGQLNSDFFWACNSDACANQGIAFLIAYKATQNNQYLTNALRNADYMLGRNATGYCYLTGFGTKSPLYPHHRILATDGVDKPFPGFLVGGPNPDNQDHVTYYSNIADQAYVDFQEAFACNEVAINWQSYVVYLLGGIDAMMQTQQP